LSNPSATKVPLRIYLEMLIRHIPHIVIARKRAIMMLLLKLDFEDSILIAIFYCSLLERLDNRPSPPNVAVAVTNSEKGHFQSFTSLIS
jgi:hypothetical protein